MKKIRTVLSSDFSIAEEQAVLTPVLSTTSFREAKHFVEKDIFYHKVHKDI